MKNRTLICTICIILIVTLCLAIPHLGISKQKQIATASKCRKLTLIIDAGHGGFDGGAVASDGTLEKDLNLYVANELKNLAVCFGYNTIMVRSSDKSTDEDGEQDGSKKVKDIKNRLELMKKHPDGIFISIHMNKYQTAQPNGAQVFYSPIEGSKNLAECIQKSIFNFVQPNNKRVVKPAGNNIYLLYHATVPAVIVECGFLSNKNDLENLKDDIYRKDLAFSVFCGIMNFVNEPLNLGE